MVEPPPKDWRRPMQLVLHSDMDQPSGARRRGARRLAGLVRATCRLCIVVLLLRRTTRTTMLQKGGLEGPVFYSSDDYYLRNGLENGPLRYI